MGSTVTGRAGTKKSRSGRVDVFRLVNGSRAGRGRGGCQKSKDSPTSVWEAVVYRTIKSYDFFTQIAYDKDSLSNNVRVECVAK